MITRDDFSEHDHSRWLCEYDASQIFSIAERLSSSARRPLASRNHGHYEISEIESDDSHSFWLRENDNSKIVCLSDKGSITDKNETLSIKERSSASVMLQTLRTNTKPFDGFLSAKISGDLQCLRLYFSNNNASETAGCDILGSSIINLESAFIVPESGLAVLHFIDLLVKSLSNSKDFLQLPSSNESISKSDLEESDMKKNTIFKSALFAVEHLRSKVQISKRLFDTIRVLERFNGGVAYFDDTIVVPVVLPLVDVAGLTIGESETVEIPKEVLNIKGREEKKKCTEDKKDMVIEEENDFSGPTVGSSLLLSEHLPVSPTDNEDRASSYFRKDKKNEEQEERYYSLECLTFSTPNKESDVLVIPSSGKNYNLTDVNNLSNCTDKKYIKRFTVTNIAEGSRADFSDDMSLNESFPSFAHPKDEEEVCMKPDKSKASLLRKPSLIPTLPSSSSFIPRPMKTTHDIMPSAKLKAISKITPNTKPKPVSKIPANFSSKPELSMKPSFTPLKLAPKPQLSPKLNNSVKLNLSMKPDLSMKSEPKSEPKSDKPNLLNRLRAVHANTNTVESYLENSTEDDVLFNNYDEEGYDEENVKVVEEDEKDDTAELPGEDSSEECYENFVTGCQLSAIEEVTSPSSSDKTINKHVQELSNKLDIDELTLPDIGKHKLSRQRGCEECNSCNEVCKLIHYLADTINSLEPHGKHNAFETSWKDMKSLIKQVLSSRNSTLEPCEACKLCEGICGIIHEFKVSKGGNLRETKEKIRTEYANVIKSIDPDTLVLLDNCSSVNDKKTDKNSKETEEKVESKMKKMSSFANDVFNELCIIMKKDPVACKKANWFEDIIRPPVIAYPVLEQQQQQQQQHSPLKDEQPSSSEFDTPTENILNDDTSAGLNTIPLFEAAATYPPNRKADNSNEGNNSSLNTLSDKVKNDIIDKINIAIYKEVDTLKKDLANRILKSLSLSVSTNDIRSIKEGLKTDNEFDVTSWTEGLSSSSSSSSSSFSSFISDPKDGRIKPVEKEEVNTYLRHNKTQLASSLYTTPVLPVLAKRSSPPPRRLNKYDLMKQLPETDFTNKSSSSNRSNPHFKQQSQLKQHTPQRKQQLHKQSLSTRVLPKKSTTPLNKQIIVSKTASSSIANDSKGASTRKRKCLKKKAPKSHRTKQQDDKVEAILTSITGITNKNNKKLSRSKKSLNGFFVESGSATESSESSRSSKSESSLDLKLNSRDFQSKDNLKRYEEFHRVSDKDDNLFVNCINENMNLKKNDNPSSSSSPSSSYGGSPANKFNNVLDSFHVHQKVNSASSRDTAARDAEIVYSGESNPEKSIDPIYKCVCGTWEDRNILSSSSCHHDCSAQKEEVTSASSSSSSSSSSPSSSDSGSGRDDFTAHTVFNEAAKSQNKTKPQSKCNPKKIKLDLPRSLKKNSSTTFIINKIKPTSKKFDITRIEIPTEQNKHNTVANVAPANFNTRQKGKTFVVQSYQTTANRQLETTNQSSPQYTSVQKNIPKPKRIIQLPNQDKLIQPRTKTIPQSNKKGSPRAVPQSTGSSHNVAQTSGHGNPRAFYQNPNHGSLGNHYGSLHNISHSSVHGSNHSLNQITGNGYQPTGSPRTNAQTNENVRSVRQTAGPVLNNTHTTTIPQGSHRSTTLPQSRLLSSSISALTTRTSTPRQTPCHTPGESIPLTRGFNITPLSKGITTRSNSNLSNRSDRVFHSDKTFPSRHSVPLPKHNTVAKSRSYENSNLRKSRSVETSHTKSKAYAASNLTKSDSLDTSNLNKSRGIDTSNITKSGGIDSSNLSKLKPRIIENSNLFKYRSGAQVTKTPKTSRNGQSDVAVTISFPNARKFRLK